jgi:hypothetical protein
MDGWDVIVGPAVVVGRAVSVGKRTSCRTSNAGSMEGSDSESDKLSCCCCCCWCSDIIMAIGMAADGLRLGLNEAVPSEVHGD